MSRYTAAACRVLLATLIIVLLTPNGFAFVADKAAADATDQKAAPSNLSAALPQSYNADPAVQTGMIVRLNDQDSSVVEPLKQVDFTYMLGVVIPNNNAAIVLTPEKVTKQQVLVATSGHYSALVSNQGGAIKVGDYITISAVAGIGMKAGEQDTQVIGRAAGAFTGTSNVIGSLKLKDSAGKDVSVSLGRVPVDMYISHNPLFQKAADYVPGFLAKAANTIADKPVSVARIYLSMAILFVISILTGNMLYSGIRNGMAAVGRNPLSKKSIIKSLIQTVIAGLIIFIAGIFAVYLLLKL